MVLFDTNVYEPTLMILFLLAERLKSKAASFCSTRKISVTGILPSILTLVNGSEAAARTAPSKRRKNRMGRMNFRRRIIRFCIIIQKV
jgi:hypothetical protein